MSGHAIPEPYDIFHDAEGVPLENGYLYFGTAGLDAAANQIPVYWDIALTNAATQPIRTVGGFPVNSGAPGTLYIAVDYSIKVQDSNTALVYSELNANNTAPTKDEKAAMTAASSPSTSNAFATTSDLTGASKVNQYSFTFRTDTGVPASAEIKLNNATPASATQVKINKTNGNSLAMGNILLLLGDGDVVTITDNSDSTKVYNYDVTAAAADNSTYVTLTVTYVGAGSGGNIADSTASTLATFFDGSDTLYLAKAQNLNDLASKSTARANLVVLGTANDLSELTASASTARGNISAQQDGICLVKTANLSDLDSSSAARASLNLGSAALLNTGTGSGTVATGNDVGLLNIMIQDSNSSTNAATIDLDIGSTNIGTTNYNIFGTFYAGYTENGQASKIIISGTFYANQGVDSVIFQANYMRVHDNTAVLADAQIGSHVRTNTTLTTVLTFEEVLVRYKKVDDTTIRINLTEVSTLGWDFKINASVMLYNRT